jgi:transglutaminase-like putative cysteine protease
MLQKISIVIALAGFGTLVGCAVYAAHHQAPVYLPAWLGFESTGSMAVGMVGLLISLNRQRRAKVLARPNR